MFKLLSTFLLAATALSANAGDTVPVFTESDFQQLKFLEGRWQGRDPQGKLFYEQYDFPDALTLRSLRFASADFAKSTDSSTVSFEDGAIVSRWGQFSWRAAQVTPDKACFEPIAAPSAFCWSVSGARLNVVQRWKDASGKEQSMTLPLTRVK